MYLWPQEETTRNSTPESSYAQPSTTSMCSSFRVIPLRMWRWEGSLENLGLRGLARLPASFWKREEKEPG